MLGHHYSVILVKIEHRFLDEKFDIYEKFYKSAIIG